MEHRGEIMTYKVFYDSKLIYECHDTFDMQCWLGRTGYKVYTYYQGGKNVFLVEVI